jgi:hypothetical protein
MFKDKETKRAYERNWCKTKGREKRREANSRWRLKKREEFKRIKTALKCKICGEPHIACLDFHHIDQSLKEGSIGVIANTYSTKRLLKEIEKCEILCANCHRKLHYNPNNN